MSLYENINKRKKSGKSRSKKDSTISAKSYANMEAGFPKKMQYGGEVKKMRYGGSVNNKSVRGPCS
tara:strand:+ start:505 stop:702 length:198 start_codon:yes stop_codon:yes gene_type:complete